MSVYKTCEIYRMKLVLLENSKYLADAEQHDLGMLKKLHHTNIYIMMIIYAHEMIIRIPFSDSKEIDVKCRIANLRC